MAFAGFSSGFMPSGNLVVVAGMLSIDQCRIGAPRSTKPLSCMMIAYDLVEAGALLHSSPGKVLPWYWVYLKGMSASFFQPGVLTVSFALAGMVTVTSRLVPASGSSGGGDCASAEIANPNAPTRDPSVTIFEAYFLTFFSPFIDDSGGFAARTLTLLASNLKGRHEKAVRDNHGVCDK